MKKLSKAQIEHMQELRTKLEDAAIAFNTARQEFEEFREEIHSDMQNFYDERSEKWQESDAAESYSSWMDTWSEEVADEIDTGFLEYPEAPE